MIVDTMTYSEILALYGEDGKLLENKIKESRKKYFHLIRTSRNTSRVYFKAIEFDSKRGFHHVVQFFNDGINKPTKQRLGQIYYACFRQKRGIFVATLSLAEKMFYHFNIYTPHFFDRYRERCLKDLSLNKSDVINTFFRNNAKVVSMKLRIPSEKYPNEYWSICAEGLCLCNYLENFVIEMKTFISKDMLREDQWEFIRAGKIHSLDKGYEISFPDEDFDDYTIE